MALPSRITELPRRSDPGPQRATHLQPAPDTAPRPRRSPLALALICVTSLLGILTIQLWLSLATSAGAYVTDDLIVQERELIRAERTMQQRVELFASPQHLSQEASKLGMVQNARPAYLKLETTALVGDLNQTSQSPRSNTVGNAALATLMNPVSQKAEDSKTSDAAATETPESGTSQPVKPTGPILWDGMLQAPQTR